ncbi:MAG TPA: hypothetical protein VGO76_16300 [Luteibacter sp.]|jgi:hypothetical protein|nr:hypothetical protein [Luteibacter sp.]
MKRLFLAGIAGILLAGGAMAQQAPVKPRADDQWGPAKAASGGAGYVPANKSTDAQDSAGHFKFKDSGPKAKDAPWPDRSAIDGKQGTNMDSSRPPLNCGQNPSDPACR